MQRESSGCSKFKGKFSKPTVHKTAEVVRTLRMQFPVGFLGVASLQQSDVTNASWRDVMTFHVRPPMLAIFVILQTMLVIGFTADCLLQRGFSRHRRPRGGFPGNSLVTCTYMTDVIILSALTTEIVLSLTSTSYVMKYTCTQTNLQFLTKATTIIWISVGIAFARLTLVEIFCHQGAEDQEVYLHPSKLRIYTKTLIYYTLLSVVLFAVPLVVQFLPEVILCVPVAQTGHQDAVMCLTMVIILIYVLSNQREAKSHVGATSGCETHHHVAEQQQKQGGNEDFFQSGSAKQDQEKRFQCGSDQCFLTGNEKICQTGSARTAQQPRVLSSITSLVQNLGIAFLTLFPFILVNVRFGFGSAPPPVFNMYKMFAFYTALSLSNITINRIYHSWSQRQIRKYQYYVI